MPRKNREPKNGNAYINAQIDAAAVTAINNSSDPFWNQAYTNAIHRTRLAVMQAGNPEPNLRETAALLANDTLLERTVTAATARTAGTPDEADGQSSSYWLRHDWLGLDHNLRNAIREGIRNTANSKLTIQCLERPGPPTPIGDRDKDWMRGRELLWDTGTLPEHVQKAIRETIR